MEKLDDTVADHYGHDIVVSWKVWETAPIVDKQRNGRLIVGLAEQGGEVEDTQEIIECATCGGIELDLGGCTLVWQ